MSIANINKDTEKRGPGRPRVYATPLMVRLRPDELAILEEFAKQAGVSRPRALSLAAMKWIRKSAKSLGAQ